MIGLPRGGRRLIGLGVLLGAAVSPAFSILAAPAGEPRLAPVHPRTLPYVTSLAFTRDGQRLISGGKDGSVRLWDLENARLEHSLLGHASDVNAVALSPDQRLAASASDDRTVRLWSLHTGEAVQTLECLTRSTAIDFAPDGRSLTNGGGAFEQKGTLELWSLPAGSRARTVVAHGDLTADVCYSPDGKSLASSGWDGKLRMWEADGSRLKWESPPGRVVAADDLVFAPDGRVLVAVSAPTVSLWEARTGRLLREFDTPSGYPYAVAFAPDGRELAVACGREDRPGTIEVRHVGSGKLLRQWDAHRQETIAIAWSREKHRIATCSFDGTTRIWEAHSGRRLVTLLGVSGLEGEASSGHWIAITPEGAFNGSPGVERALEWHGAPGTPAIPLDFAAQRDPHRVRELLARPSAARKK